MPRKYVIGGALASASTVWAAGWLGSIAGVAHARTVESVGWTLVALVAGAAALATARDPSQGRARRSFLFLGLGSLAWGLGQAASTVAALDGYRLAGTLLLAAGIVLWPRRRKLWTKGLVFDAVLVGAVGVLVSYDVALKPMGLSYPAFELVLVAVIVAGLLVDAWADRRRLMCIGGGLLALAFAPHFDPWWAIAFGAIAVATLMRRRTPDRSRRRVPASAVGLVTTMLVALVATVHTLRELKDGWGEALDAFVIALLLVLAAVRAMHMARISPEHVSRLRQAEKKLRDTRRSRNRFLVELVNAQERETRKIGDLLHDDVVQQLTALGFRLELEAQRLGAPRLQELARDTSEITSSIRRLLVELHPAILDSQGLAPAVDVVGEGLRERGIDVRVAPFPHRLPRELETLAYRLVQEALANVLRHSRAATVDVELGLEHGVLHGRVSDSGWGLAQTESGSEGLGLLVARERVELAGGRFSVRSQLGHGTDFVFELPVAAEEAAA